MAMNLIQFQHGLSLPAFLQQFGTEAQCEEALKITRWPNGFQCPRCGQTEYSLLHVGRHDTFQCKNCRLQTSLIAGTLFQSTHLPLTLWFLAIYLISQAKTGLSALALKRQLGVSYPTAWLVYQKLMQAMSERDVQYTLVGRVLLDDAYLGGELSGGKSGRGSENKVPFIAAVSLNHAGNPLYIKMAIVPGFTRKAIADWAEHNLSPSCTVISDGLACFSGVTDIGCRHKTIVEGGRKPKEMPEFTWINTIIGNLKTSFSGAYHAFKFAKYGTRYLAAFVYRFNRRFNLETLPTRLLAAAVSCQPHSARWLRMAEASF
jgi:ISXO2-like transposase domain/Transposase zinc-ribbon domain